MEENMMKTVKKIVKRERQKRRRRVGIMIVLIALCAAAIFFGTKAYHNYKEEEFCKSVKEKEIKVTPKSITHKQTDIFTQSYQKETDDYATSPYRKMSIMLMILSVVIIISNLYGLYTRNLVVNLVFTVLLLLAGKCIFPRKVDGIALLWRKLRDHL
mgnify:CR=1 FL=1